MGPKKEGEGTGQQRQQRQNAPELHQLAESSDKPRGAGSIPFYLPDGESQSAFLILPSPLTLIPNSEHTPGAKRMQFTARWLHFKAVTLQSALTLQIFYPLGYFSLHLSFLQFMFETISRARMYKKKLWDYTRDSQTFGSHGTFP